MERRNILISALSLLLGLFTIHCQETYPGKVNKSYLTKSLTIHSTWDCRKKQCGRKVNCAVAYDSKEKKCYLVMLAWELLKWDFDWERRSFLPQLNSRWKILGSSPRVEVSVKPTILWILDEIWKGVNFGTATRYLDLKTDNVTWTVKGPRPSNVNFGRSELPARRVLHQGNQKLIDLSHQFSIAMWIKTDSVFQDMVIIDSYPEDALHLMLFPGKQRDSLTLGTGSKKDLVEEEKYGMTMKNSTKVNEWRHVAVVFYSKTNFKFYLEGHDWPIKKNSLSGASTHFSEPAEILLWSKVEGLSFQYKGSYACVAIYQSAVSSTNIKALRDNCP